MRKGYALDGFLGKMINKDRNPHDSTRNCGIEQKKNKIFVIVRAHTIAYPGTVMVHS